ncbi:MAG: LysM peptidoglycan-binding domain-containing protein [Candidatus Acidiferrales bacterium]
MTKRKTAIWAILAAGLLAVAGCNDSAKVVRVQPPALAPTIAPAYASLELPLPANLTYQPPISEDPTPPIDILVAKVQANYDQGVQEESAGNDDQAQIDFDHAVKLIVKSGFQAGADPRLSKLFDELGEEVSPDEINAAVADDQAQTQAPVPPAPIDEIDDLSLPAGDPRLAMKAEGELIRVRHDLPLTVNDSVLRYVSFFTTPRGRAIVERGLERGGRYDAMIRRVLKQEGLPQDLIYLAQAESAFQPDAVSRAGARGLWQFMPFDGEKYDLDRSYWTDERSDPEKSTHAAAQYLRNLYGMFGDWYLAMAAYNSGPMTVARAVQRTGYADYWQLQKMRALPVETQNYVPIIIALALVSKDPSLYGVQVDPSKPMLAEQVKLDHQISLNLVADASGADVEDLRTLNPELLRGLTPNEPGFVLNLPAGTKKTFEENIQQVPENKWTSWRLYSAASGETLPDIARHFRVTVASLEAANHLEAHAAVPAGFELNIPAPPPRARLIRYRVQRGDTLERIADRFDVSVEELKRWNHIYGNHVRRGARLRIYAGSLAEEDSRRERSAHAERPEPHYVAARSTDKLSHHVRAGETLYSIARLYQTTVSDLRQWNPFLADRGLEAGDILSIER